MATKIQIRRDTAANWTSAALNPTIASVSLALTAQIFYATKMTSPRGTITNLHAIVQGGEANLGPPTSASTTRAAPSSGAPRTSPPRSPRPG